MKWSRSEIFSITAITAALTAALIWLPMTDMWWHLASRAYYLPIIMVGARYGSIAGLFAGAVASLLCAFVATLHGMGDMAWLSIVTPDFAVVGFLGGRFLGRRPLFERPSTLVEADVWSTQGGVSAPQMHVDLNRIASIQGAAGLLADTDAPAELREELADIISTECQHLSDSIAGLLQKALSAESHVCEASIASVIDAAAQQIEFILCAHGVSVRKAIATDLPLLQCDPGQVRNLLICLMINTVKSANPVRELLVNARPGNDGILLEVRDASRLPLGSRVLSRFIGSYPAKKGVGLAAAYDIVRQHRGKIEAIVNVRKGLEFSVWLPLRRDGPNGNWQGSGGGGR